MVLREKGSETGEEAREIKALRAFRATPKPWVAGSNPPAPAKNPRSCWARIFTFSLFTFNFSLKPLFGLDFWEVRGNSEEWKGEISQTEKHHFPIRSNNSVWYSIKKASRNCRKNDGASKKYQKSRPQVHFSCGRFLFVYSVSIFVCLTKANLHC